MYKLNLVKSYFFIFLSISSTTHCMLTTSQEKHEITKRRLYNVYADWSSQISTSLEKQSTEYTISNNEENFSLEKEPIIGIIKYRKTTDTENNVTCLGYALAKAMNTPQILKFPQKLTLHSYDTADIYKQLFFERTEQPQKNDLVTYQNYPNSNNILHYAIVADKNIFESKWGTQKIIIQHNPSAVPCNYIPYYYDDSGRKDRENTITYWTLKEEFKTDKGKEVLNNTIKHETINEDINYFEDNYTAPIKAKQIKDKDINARYGLMAMGASTLLLISMLPK